MTMKFSMILIAAATLKISQAAVQSVTLVKIAGAATNCSDYTHSVQLASDVSMLYLLTPTTLSVRLEVGAERWVGFGISPNSGGKMVGSDAIIGLPLNPLSASNPGKYVLAGESVNTVTLRDSAAQTLTTGNIFQNSGKTFLAFSKKLEEYGEHPILTSGSNYFLWAYGFANTLGLHEGSGSFSIDAASTLCSPPVATAAPSPAPVVVTTAPVTKPTTAPVVVVSAPLTKPTTAPVVVISAPVTKPTTVPIANPQNAPVSTPTEESENGESEQEDSSSQQATTAPTATPQNAPVSASTEESDTSDEESSGNGESEQEDSYSQASTEVETETDSGEKNAASIATVDVNNSTLGHTNATTCADYQHFVQIDNKLAMYYVVNDSGDGRGTISIKLEFDGLAWISWGVSPDGSGKMIGGQAVIALPDEPPSATNPGEYSMTQYSNSGVVLSGSEQQTLINGNVVQENGKTIATFIKLLSETNKAAILGSGENTFIWAYGFSNTLGLHQGKGNFRVTLAPCTAASTGLEVTNLSSDGYSENKKKRMWTAHAFLGLAAWGILAPAAFSASWLRGLLSSWGGLWFKIHFYCNILVSITTLITFILAVLLYNNDGDEHFDDTHQNMGLAILVLVILQASNGLFRPAAPHAEAMDDEDDPESRNPSSHAAGTDERASNPGADDMEVSAVEQSKTKAMVSEAPVSQETPVTVRSKARAIWEACHKLIGYFLLCMGLYQVSSGIELYAELYGTNDYTVAFWGVMGSCIILVVLLTVYLRFKR